jgi:dTDP-4-amino-4,6-dideoxygalactose transaminase
MNRPALLGGTPAFADGLPIARPATPPLERVMERLRPSWDSGRLTNGKLVAALEEAAAERLEVPEVVAVSSCTAGLMLVLQALDPKESVVLPSFTFSATAHAVVWNGLRPVFAESESDTFQIDVADAEARSDGAGALVGTHVFGSPCRAEAMEELAATRGVPLVFDAAHCFGSRRGGRPIGGFGAAEVFSLSPTKPVIAGEGGLVATRDPALAATLRTGRDYGNPGDYNTRFAGLNARMSELHAAVALESLALLEHCLDSRLALAARYRAGFDAVPGVAPQVVADGDTSTYKDFTVSIDADQLGLSRDALRRALTAEGIETRTYFDPPVHRQTAYGGLEPVALPRTDALAGRVLSLPMFDSLPLEVVDGVVATVAAIAAAAEEVTAALDT